MLVADDGTIVLANRQLERQFGYAPGELLGQPVEVVLPDALSTVHGGYREAFMQAPAAGPTGTGRELFGQRRDGSRFAGGNRC